MINAKRLTNCAWCNAEIMRRPFNPNKQRPILRSFCDNQCKAHWQRENLKPEGVTREWLVQKYEVECLDCAEIGRLVSRDTKRVWEWLRDYGIKTRSRGTSTKKQWARGERDTFSGWKMSEEGREKIRQARLRDGRVPYLTKDGSHYMKGRRGKDHHGWQGGLTPEREALAQTEEWKSVVKFVWRRADAKCERCGVDHRKVDNRKANGFHVHHITPFRFKELRADPTNLALLCRPCHHFIHSKKNVDKEFIRDGD
jgi:hypothetical protein